MLCVTQVFAQNRTVTGTVTAKDDGQPFPGATVKVKGTNSGTQSSIDGKFTIAVPPGGSIVITAVGYVTQTIVVGNQTNLKIALELSATALTEVQVTTALGIKHNSKELAYAASTVTPKDLTQTNVTNLANGLTGKVAGLGVFSLDNGIDPSISINLRGFRSLEGNNGALIVLDGVPVPSQTISAINPNDVADVTVLKGAGAAALYGSQASNGAILITTKRGSADGKPVVTYGNSFQFQKVAFYPKLQNGFGQYGGEPNYIDPLTGFTEQVPYENQLYGPPFDGSIVQEGAPLDSANGKVIHAVYSALPTNPIESFFNTGYTEQNDISYSQGKSAENSFFISAQNVTSTGVVPNDKNLKDAFSVRGHTTYGIFSMDYSVGYTKTNVSTYINNGKNTLGLGGGFTNADLYTTVLQWPANLNIKNYSDPSSDIGNPSNFYDAYAINPYWTVDNARDNYERDQILSQLKLKLDPTKWLSASYQLSNNFGIYQDRETKQEVDFTAYGISDYFHAGNVPSGFTSGKSLGQVYDYYAFGDGTSNGYNRIEGEGIIDFHHNFIKDLRTELILGNDVYQQYRKDQYTGSSQLLIPNLYNINYIGGLISGSEASYTIRQIAYFADVQIGWKGWLNLEGSFRNEHDSRLSAAERSFSYPSAKLSFIPTDAIPALKNNNFLSFMKLYGSISQVGNINVGPYNIYNTYSLAGGFPYGSLGGLTANTGAVSPTLKPELTKEIEFGAEISFFHDRLYFNYSHYSQHDKNQTVSVGTSIATGYSSQLINVGETLSYGNELTVKGDILTQQANKFGLSLEVDLSNNEGRLLSLIPGTNSLSLGNNEYAVVGLPFPYLEGTDFQRDPQGRVVVSATSGYPLQDATGIHGFGRTTPEYIASVKPTLSYKFVSLSALFEYRGGYVVYNALGSTMVFAGSSALTAEAGRQRFIYPNSVIETAPGVYTPNTSISVVNGQYGFWQGSNFSQTQSPFVTSGAFWKLRELALNFNLNKFVKESKFIKGASITFTGRNLFIWTPKSNIWTDPEFSNAGPNGTTPGVNDTNQLPGTRVYGADLKLTF